MGHDILTIHTLAAVLAYAGLGAVALFLVLIVFDKVTPFDLWKEIIDEQNQALAILLGFLSLGLAIIIAAALLG